VPVLDWADRTLGAGAAMKAQWCGRMSISTRWTAGTIALLLAAVLGGCAQSGSLPLMRSARAVRVTGGASGAWSAPELIPAHNLGTGSPQPPAFDINGDAVAVWTEPALSIKEPITPSYLVRAAVRPAHGHWQPADTLSRLGLAPEVAVDAGGDAIAVWESPSGVQAAMRPAGGNWLAPQTVATPGGEDPQIASDPSGAVFVVATRQAPGRSTGIQTVSRPAGGTFSPAQAISTSENAFHPRIAMNARGDAFVAWEVDLPRGCAVRAAFRPADGGWSAPRTLSDTHAFCPANQRVAIDERGDAIVVWLALRRRTTFIEAAGRTAEGRWTARRTIARARDIAEPPEVGMDARGDATIVWSEPALVGGWDVIRVRTRPAGRGWQAVRALPYANAGRASLAIDARGDALVAWQGKRGIEAAARPAGGHWQKPYMVSGHEPTHRDVGGDPLATLDAGGDGLVAWENHEGIETAWRPALFP
jgi:hypothetical protein